VIHFVVNCIFGQEEALAAQQARLEQEAWESQSQALIAQNDELESLALEMQV
jgi:hypothetical protein